MKVYLLYEIADSDDLGQQIEIVKSLYTSKITAQEVMEVYIKRAEDGGQDYRYSIVPRMVECS